jgi:hypothetical protein
MRLGAQCTKDNKNGELMSHVMLPLKMNLF